LSGNGEFRIRLGTSAQHHADHDRADRRPRATPSLNAAGLSFIGHAADAEWGIMVAEGGLHGVGRVVIASPAGR
jgi:hypothetical protein